MTKPKLAVWKFASCDGCQLTLLDCRDQLVTLAEHVHIATFLEVSSAVAEGPYDVSLVEGSISTPADILRIQEIRDQSTVLIAIGACATAGGVQALRNLADVNEFASVVYASPEYIDTLASSSPASRYVTVDHELHGCPIDREQLLDTLTAVVAGRKPALSAKSVCTECKARGVTCLVVAESIPCLGPVTHAGCGAICPSYHRGCYGCFGPAETPNLKALLTLLHRDNLADGDVERIFRTFNVSAFAELTPPRS